MSFTFWREGSLTFSCSLIVRYKISHEKKKNVEININIKKSLISKWKNNLQT